MSKNTCQQYSEIALKEAIQQDEWILLIGGTCKERKRLSEAAYRSKECVESVSVFCMYFHKLSRATELQSYDYDRIFRNTKFNKHKFVLLDVAGCSSKEMSRKILGPESEKEYKSPNDLLRNKPILNILIQERLLFIDNFCCKNEDYMDVVKKISAQLRMYRSDYQGYKLGPLIVGVESKKDCEKLPHMFVELFKFFYLEIEKDYEVKEQEGIARKVKALVENKPQRTSYKSNKEYIKILDDVLKGFNKPLETHPSLRGMANKVVSKMNEQGMTKKKKIKKTGELKDTPLYTPNTVKTHIQKHKLYPKIMNRKKKAKVGK